MDASWGRKDKYSIDTVMASSIPPSPRRLHHDANIPLGRRFGWYATVTLVLGTFILLGCVSFISFLWASENTNIIWRRIVVAGWVTRSITISTLILRIVSSAQAALATSMMAALMLNWFQVRLPGAAAVSLMRFSNTGPGALLRHLPTQLATRGAGLSVLVVSLAVCSFLLQLSSTALLSNVGLASIVIPSPLPNVSYGISSGLSSQPTENIGYDSVRPASQPTFAEYTESAATPATGTKDTGLSIRAFLPINDSNARNDLVSYEGKATLMDTRVACVQPQLSKIKVIASYGQPSISGWVQTDKRISDFWPLRSSKLGVPFNCSWALQGDQSSSSSSGSEWPLVLCSIGNSEDDLEIQSPIQTQVSNRAFLLINSTGTTSEWDPINKAGGKFAVSSLTPQDEWLSLENGKSSATIKLTFCMSSRGVMDKTITASRSGPVNSEPTVGWTNKTMSFDTFHIRKQLGVTATAYSQDERGIFSLDNPTLANKSVPLQDYAIPAVIYSAAFNSNTLRANNSIFLCKYCQPSSLDFTAKFHSDIFSDILHETSNPALAIQSLVTTLFSMSYYDHFYQFDSIASANITTRISVIRPTSSNFFFAFLVVIACHTLLVAFVAVLFAFSSPTTMLGNAWSAVSQLRASETESWLVMASNLSDSELASAMKDSDSHNVNVGISSEGQELYIRRRRAIVRND